MGVIECWLLLENLALRGTAVQSTTSSTRSANRAIDGGKDSSTFSTTCATTDWERNPWWRLDLQVVYRVNTVVVTYKDDSLPGRWKDIQVKFGISLQNDGNDNPRCAVISSNPAANSFIYSCSDREGRYVNVFVNEWSDFLSVCEVEVYETDYSSQSFIKMTFNSTANLTDPTVKDSVLNELKSAFAVRGITNVTLSWSQTPEEEITVIQNEHENDPC